MKIAIAGKGGVGKTTITAWLADFLARRGQTVWMVDADTALSLGQASGLERAALPEALVRQKTLLEERIRPGGGSMLDLNPDVKDLPESLFINIPLHGPVFEGCSAGEKRLLVMGALSNAGGGCACESNALLKALLAHLVLEREEWVLIDLEAGVEHLGRGTVAHVDQLLIVSEPSLRSVEIAAEVGRMGEDLGLTRQLLLLNRACPKDADLLPPLHGLPERCLVMPDLESLKKRQMHHSSVFELGEPASASVDAFLLDLLCLLQPDIMLKIETKSNLHTSGHPSVQPSLRGIA